MSDTPYARMGNDGGGPADYSGFTDKQLLQHQSRSMEGEAGLARYRACLESDFGAFVLCSPPSNAEQDRMLDEISKGVGNLHQYASAIGEEADHHVVRARVPPFGGRVRTPLRRANYVSLHTIQEILNDMDRDVDKAQNALVAETEHAKSVRKKSATCRLWICILLLLGVLMLQIFLFFA